MPRFGLLGSYPVLLRYESRHGTVVADRRIGVELVAVPVDLDLVAAGMICNGDLEAALPEVAPRTDHVGPDVDSHDTNNTREGLSNPAAGCDRRAR